MSREAMQQALEALEAHGAHAPNCDHLMLLTSLPPQRKPCSCGLVSAITNLRAALAEPEQEPVAWLRADGMKSMPNDEKEAWLATGRAFDREIVEDYTVPLYTAPTPRKPLTDAEIVEIAVSNSGLSDFDFARAIERAHGIGEQT